MKKIILFLLLITGSNLNPNYAEIKDIRSYFNDNVLVKKLSNGINVQILKRGYTPTAALIISFKVGSSDESYQNNGVAHMLEHMLFKGTDKIGTKNYKKEKKILDRIEAVGESIDRLKNESPENMLIPDLIKELKRLQQEHKKYVINTPYSKIYAQLGGVGFNASTSRDYTMYVVELPTAKIETWASLEYERLRKPVFRQYYLEREAVVQERLMRYDSQGSNNLQEKFFGTAFMAHPYRHPVIGWETSIPRLSLKEVKKFYYRYYIPERMNITVVGKQNPQETLKILEKYFGKLKSRPNPPFPIVSEIKQRGERRIKIKFKSSPYLIIGWHKPKAPSKEDYAGDIVSYLLSSGRNSILRKKLIEEKKIVSEIDSANGYPGSRYNNLFVIDASPKTGIKTSVIEEAIYTEIDILKENILEKDIKIIYNKIKSGLIFGLNSNKRIARQINYNAAVVDNWKYNAEYLENIKKVTIEDVKGFIVKYLNAENRTVGILVPKK